MVDRDMDLNENCEDIVHIPQDLLVKKYWLTLLSLVQFVYSQILLNIIHHVFMMDQ